MGELNEILVAELQAKAPMRARRVSMATWMSRLLGRIRTQLIGGFLFGVILPSLLSNKGRIPTLDNTSGFNALIATSWAFLAGYLIFRKVTAFPGVRATANILPVFLVSYAGVVTYMFALRLDYSRLQIFASFLLTTLFFYTLFLLMRRGQKPSMEIVAAGDISRHLRIRSVDWIVLSSPDAPQSARPLVVDMRAHLGSTWEKFVAEAAMSGRSVYNAKDVVESLLGRVQVEHMSENPFGSLSPSGMYTAAKRLVDFWLALLLLLVTWPIMLLVGVLIRLDTPGPSLFRQARMGYRGVPFTCFKFRTMTDNKDQADTLEASMTKLNDPRITRLGAILRRTRLDELPQLFNVIRGEMSFIGPRPEALPLSQWYEERIPFYRFRHAVRPGITGWAQVTQGHVTSLEDAMVKLEYDFFYAKHFSLWLDFLVLARTLSVMTSGRGSK